MGHFSGQGATEYLVLLAVVLVIALVAIALLGFFPGMASDAKMTQSEMYWKSASPISILEGWAQAKTNEPTIAAYLYLRIRNSWNYPIRITKIVGGSYTLAKVWTGVTYVNISDYYYMAPGEELYFGGYGASEMSGLANRRAVVLCLVGQSCLWDYDLPAA